MAFERRTTTAKWRSVAILRYEGDREAFENQFGSLRCICACGTQRKISKTSTCVQRGQFLDWSFLVGVSGKATIRAESLFGWGGEANRGFSIGHRARWQDQVSNVVETMLSSQVNEHWANCRVRRHRREKQKKRKIVTNPRGDGRGTSPLKKTPKRDEHS